MSDPGRRELRGVLLLVAVGALTVLGAAGRTWVSVRQPGAVPPLDESFTGSDLTRAPSTLGLLGLAAVPALLATKRLGRVLLGVLLVVSSALVGAAVVASVRGLEPFPDQVAGLVNPAFPVGLSTSGWPWVALVGCVLVALAGLAAALRGARWQELSARYDRTRPAQVVVEEDEEVGGAQGWAALDRGEDPTR